MRIRKNGIPKIAVGKDITIRNKRTSETGNMVRSSGANSLDSFPQWPDPRLCYRPFWLLVQDNHMRLSCLTSQNIMPFFAGHLLIQDVYRIIYNVIASLARRTTLVQ